MAVFFQEIEARLLENLSEAKSRIEIAVAWFTNPRLYEVLIKKLDEGVKITLIVRDDEINNNSSISLKWQDFVDAKGELYFDKRLCIHHKFCILDAKKVITGSYNWTKNAELHNRESVLVITDINIVRAFSEEFEDLKYVASRATPEDINCRDYNGNAQNQADVFDGEVGVLDEKTLEQYLVKADWHYRQKEYEKALKILDDILNQGENAEAFCIRGWVYFRQGKHKEALENAHFARELEHSDASDLYNLMALCCAASKQYTEAKKYFKQAIEEEKKKPNESEQNIIIPRNNLVGMLCRLGVHSEYEREKIALSMEVAEIIKGKDTIYQNVPFLIMHAYLVRLYDLPLVYRPERKALAEQARSYYDKLEEWQQDKHDWDVIHQEV